VNQLIYQFHDHSLFHISDDQIAELENMIEEVRKFLQLSYTLVCEDENDEAVDGLINEMSSFMRRATVKDSRDKSVMDDSSMSKNSKPGDIKDLIEDFLCGDIVPKIKKNKRLLNYLC
jgi:hypothetical protein